MLKTPDLTFRRLLTFSEELVSMRCVYYGYPITLLPLLAMHTSIVTIVLQKYVLAYSQVDVCSIFLA